MAKYTEGERAGKPLPTRVYWRIGRRCLLLFVLGLLLNGFSGFLVNGVYDFSTIRIMGVLQRIALAYLLAALIVLHLSRSRQWLFAALILLGYWLALAIGGDFSPTGNLGATIDQWLFGPAHGLVFGGVERQNWENLSNPPNGIETVACLDRLEPCHQILQQYGKRQKAEGRRQKGKVDYIWF